MDIYGKWSPKIYYKRPSLLVTRRRSKVPRKTFYVICCVTFCVLKYWEMGARVFRVVYMYSVKK